MDANLKQNKLSVGTFLKLFIPFALGYLLSDLYRSVNAVLSPILIEEFSLTASDLGLITSAYFLGFAALQLPLGVALDRFGARRTLAVTILFAGLGSFLYGTADSALFLIIGRALIGFGVGGCLMGAYKAYSEWVPAERVPLVNSFHTFIGGMGVVLATKPVHVALDYVDWRQIFLGLAVLTVVVSITIFFVVPKREQEGSTSESIKEQFSEIKQIIKSNKFLCLLPIATCVQATYLSLNTLWAGPWFMDVAGFSNDMMANLLLILSISLVAGYLLNGVFANWLRRYRIQAITVSVTSMTVFTITLGLLGVVSLTGGTAGTVLWPLLIFSGPFVLLCYPIFSSMFDVKLSGRVITLYNLAVFLTSSIFQWLIGVIIDLWPVVETGSFNPKGYSAALLFVFALHAASLIWFFATGRKALGFFNKKSDNRSMDNVL